MAKRLRQLGLVLAVALTMASLGMLDTKAARVTCLVSTTNGAVQGLDVGASCTFLGIPYAAAPTNARRWKAPESPGPLATSPFAATLMPPSCPNVNMGPPAGMEDCLKLNIWVRNPLPATPAPVIVWLHTGGFVASSANFASHNGKRFTEDTGVIIVAPNYRLGPLGFLVHSALAAEDPTHAVSGNYGLLDQRKVLEYVRDNIAAFGGDPNNVTLAGTSAGADSVGLHLISPGSAGLFHRAIIESGTPTLQWPTHAELLAQGDAFATALGCTDPATVLTCMRGKPRDPVMTALPLAPQTVLEPAANRVFWMPVVDGVEIPDQPRYLFDTSRFHPVPTIIGFTRDEAAGAFISRSFSSGVTLANYQDWLASEFGGLAPAVLGQYPPGAYPLPADAMSQVVGDGQFVCEGRRFARALADRHVPAFFYSYDYVIDDVFPDKVIHGVESNILFGNTYVPNQFPNHALNAADLALHSKMAGYWSRFAATGNPNIEDDTVVHWQDFRDPLGAGRGANRYLVLDTVIRSQKRFRESACDFWEPYFSEVDDGKGTGALELKPGVVYAAHA